ncbi:MAG: hypothetical protein ACFNUU_01200, partial [Campylobacter sp.]|uniref:hypothetical protein n=1 Tax=Campylobacter sp. TaxID=205 RepID=UPI0036165ED9
VEHYLDMVVVDGSSPFGATISLLSDSNFQICFIFRTVNPNAKFSSNLPTKAKSILCVILK